MLRTRPCPREVLAARGARTSASPRAPRRRASRHRRRPSRSTRWTRVPAPATPLPASLVRLLEHIDHARNRESTRPPCRARAHHSSSAVAPGRRLGLSRRPRARRRRRAPGSIRTKLISSNVVTWRSLAGRSLSHVRDRALLSSMMHARARELLSEPAERTAQTFRRHVVVRREPFPSPREASPGDVARRSHAPARERALRARSPLRGAHRDGVWMNGGPAGERSSVVGQPTRVREPSATRSKSGDGSRLRGPDFFAGAAALRRDALRARPDRSPRAGRDRRPEQIEADDVDASGSGRGRRRLVQHEGPAFRHPRQGDAGSLADRRPLLRTAPLAERRRRRGRHRHKSNSRSGSCPCRSTGATGCPHGWRRDETRRATPR